MNIWVDADACPVVVKEILYRAADRTQTLVIFVANQFLSVPPSPYIKFQQVPAGFDVADNEIVEQVNPEDLVITADIPLASEVIDKQATALNPRGELYTKSNIRQRLNMRDFMDTMRASGMETGGQAKFSDKDKQNFANELDKYLTRAQKARANLSQ